MKRIYTDGGCSVHLNKIGGWAFVVVDENDDLVHSEWGGKPYTTNSEMEITAILNALQYTWEKFPDEDVTIHSDSSYCVQSYNEWLFNWEKNNWRKSNKKDIAHPELWKKIHKLRRKGVNIEWIKAHAGHKYNELVDSLTHNFRLRDDGESESRDTVRW